MYKYFEAQEAKKIDLTYINIEDTVFHGSLLNVPEIIKFIKTLSF